VLSEESDEHLAGRSSSDPAAFAEIYERYVDGVYGYCFRRLGSREYAEDATSLVFSRALAAIDRFTPTASLRSWIFTIAHNVIMDQYRRARRQPEFAIDETWDAPDSDPSPEDIAILRENVELLDRLMMVLSEDQRQVVELRLSGLTGPEIQVVLDRGRSWVNTTQFRAVSRMRQALDEMKGGSDV
jgi:RNA polymerase sigma-70 factor (ECF subfamily)